MNAPTNKQRTSWSRSRNGRSLLAKLVSFVFMVGLVGVLSSSAFAQTLTVTNTNDSGTGSLREAIALANSGDTITFSPDLNGQTITLTSGQLYIGKELTIEGPGEDKLAVSGNKQSRVLNICSSFPVSISGLTIKEGFTNSPTEGYQGGGIAASCEGTIKLTNVTVSDNTATAGGGIYRTSGAPDTMTELTNVTVRDNSASSYAGGGIFVWGGTWKLTNSTVSNNTAYHRGGGISNEFGDPSPNAGTVILTNSTVSGNTSYRDGGGIANKDGMMVLTDSTVSNNTASEGSGGIGNSYKLTLINSTVSNNTVTDAGYYGGGIASGGADATTEITNSTVSNNTAHYGGGGIYNAYSTVKLTNSTVSNNNNTYAPYAYGGGIMTTDGGTTNNLVHNTIIAGNSSSYGRDVNGPFTSLGHNLIGDGTGGDGFTQEGDQVGTTDTPIDPRLGSLQDNGGPTLTHALLPGSLAIDAAVAVEGITTDQRGVARPQGAAPDIGSFELEDAAAPTTTPSATTADGNTYNPGEWTNQNVTLTLTAEDEQGGSSVDKIFYNTDASTNYQEYTAPLSVTSEGSTTVSYYATDKAGNQGEAKTFAVKIDKRAPTTTATLSAQANANGWHKQNVTITLRATDQAALSGVKEITYSATGAQPIAQTKVPGSSKQLTITKDGQTTVTYFATDQAGNAEQPKTLTIKMNKSAPKVVSVTPADGTMGVDRGTNVTATISEDMNGNTINTTTFKLFKKGSSTAISATVSYNPTTRTATLNPFGSSTTLLARGTTYKAVVTTGAKDQAGTALDQNPSVAGSQQMVWYFTIRT